MKNKAILIIVIITTIVALVPIFIKNSSLLTILCNILLYIALATSWNILGGYAGQVSLGHSAFFGLGALITRLTWIAGWPLFISILLGSLVAVLFALLIGSPAFKLKGAYFTIGTLALGQVLYATVGNIFSTSSTLPPDALKNYDLNPRFYLFLGVAFIAVLTAYLLTSSKFGLGLKAVREEEDAAETLGVNAFKHKLIAFAVSAFLTGLAGGAFAYFHVGYYPQYPFSTLWSLDPQMMSFIGGTGTIIGPIIGAVFFQVLKQYVSLNFGEFHLLIFGVMFILVVLFLPGGLVGLWKKVQNLYVNKKKKVTQQPE